MKVLLPKDYIHPKMLPKPLFFLAGPIRGGDDWQYRAFKLLESKFSDFTIIIPCRYDSNHPLKQIASSGKKEVFERQTQWERFYLHEASVSGCIVFWLPEESKLNPRTDGSPYARDTYGELGEWRGRMIDDECDRIHVVIGAEEGFPGLSQIKCNFDTALQQSFPIWPTLEQTVDAVRFQMEKYKFV